MKLRVVYVFAVIGIVFSVFAAILYSIGCDWSSAIGAVSTIISIVLGVVSIIYTYVSGEHTIKTLEEIERQNRKLVDKINHELSKDNFNEKNIEYIQSTIKK